jgi:hypothetical protein
MYQLYKTSRSIGKCELYSCQLELLTVPIGVNTEDYKACWDSSPSIESTEVCFAWGFFTGEVWEQLRLVVDRTIPCDSFMPVHVYKQQTAHPWLQLCCTGYQEYCRTSHLSMEFVGTLLGFTVGSSVC